MLARTEWVSIHDRPAYFCIPEHASGLLPAVIIIHGAMGLDDYVQDLSHSLASVGYATLAPDLYDEGAGRPAALSQERIKEAAALVSRLGPSPRIDSSALMKMIASLPDRAKVQVPETLNQMRLIGDVEVQGKYINVLRRAVGYLKTCRPETKGQKVSVLGEGLSILLACREPELSGCVVLYGNTPSDVELSTLHCSVLGLYAENDPHVYPRIVELSAACVAHGQTLENYVYKGAYHGFNNDATSNFDIQASRHAFTKILAFLLRTLAEGEVNSIEIKEAGLSQGG
jgi:carboxymethylenebutenolidase